MRKNSAEAATAIAALIKPETSPLIDPAKATMQTNSGAGLGTAMTLPSTKTAIRAVAAVRAGPEVAGQSTFMRLFSFVPRVKRRKLPGGCVSGDFLASSLTGGLPKVAAPREKGPEDDPEISVV